ncbi:MAG: sulfur carrier protein ThiS adenylyltransferase ThiF [Eggerthellaceae bacterium]
MEVSQEELQRALAARLSPEQCGLLHQARVGIAGLGGLGSHIAVFLARCGVGMFHLVDFDRVEVSNLNRQHYFIEHLGQLKTEALAGQLARINPWIDVALDSVRVTEENAAGLFTDDLLLCEAFDVATSKAFLVNTLLAENPAIRIVAASGMAGVSPANEVHTRAVGRRLYVCGDETTAVGGDAPLFASRVALCAAHQAHQIVRLILKQD